MTTETQFFPLISCLLCS